MNKQTIKSLMKLIAILFIMVAFTPNLLFCQNTELLLNPGFEDNDMSMWQVKGFDVAKNSDNKKSGLVSLSVTNRQYYSASPTQDITSILLKAGAGNYDFSANMRLAPGLKPVNMYVVISIECSGSKMKWSTGNAVKITDAIFTESLANNININWKGALTKALIYVQNVDDKIQSNFFVDDFSLSKVIATNASVSVKYIAGPELLLNPGFEEKNLSMWVSDNESSLISTIKNSGKFSMSVNKRQNYYTSSRQNITNILNNGGQTTYNFGAFLRLASGLKPTKMYVVISIESSGEKVKWYTSANVLVNDKTFTSSTIDNINITWKGNLLNALIYAQNEDHKISPDFIVDDYSLTKAIVVEPPLPLPPIFISTKQSLSLRDEGLPAIGAIRWDGWLPKEDKIGLQVARSLGPNKYHFRLPYFAIANGENSIDFPAYTQSHMDAEIGYAEYAGIDYWAYCWYPIDSTLAKARDLHISSKLNEKVKICAILNVCPFGTKERLQLIGNFKKTFYKKVQSGRPLVYFYDNKDALATIITIQQDCLLQNIPMPYFVSMEANEIGFDAVSAYSESASGGESFNNLSQSLEAKWDIQRATGSMVIPLITTGWDPRPRWDNPVKWTKVTEDNWTQTATTDEIVKHTQNCLNWTKKNTKSTLANAILIYSWNEFDEGGWLCPTTSVDEKGMVLQKDGINILNTDRIDALHKLLKR